MPAKPHVRLTAAGCALIAILLTLMACSPETERQLNETINSAAKTAAVELQNQVGSSAQTAVAEGINSVQTQMPALQKTAEEVVQTESARIQTEVAKSVGGVVPPSPNSKAVLDYFALGDSIASGHGLMDSGGDCRRSPKAYPYQLNALLVQQYKQVNFQHIACSGASVGNPGLNFLEMLGDKRFKWFNNQVDDVLRQLSDRPTLITITIGANDLHWTDWKNFLYRMNQPSDGYFDWLKKLQAEVSNDLIYQIERLRKNHPNVSILLTDVFNPVNEKDSKILFLAGLCKDLYGVLTCYERTSYGVSSLFVAYGDVWGYFKYPDWLKFVPLNAAFAGHASPSPACGSAAPGTDSTWIQYPGMPGSNADVPQAVELVTGQKYGDCFHPNEEGARQIAARLYEYSLRLK